MATLGLVSDTHGLFDPQLRELFAGVEEILHAGDIGPSAVIEELSALAPVSAIKGNIDERYPTKSLPAVRAVEKAGQRFLLVHDAGKPVKPTPAFRELLHARAPTIVVSGHSHKARMEQVGDRLFINPGSAGKKRFSLERTAGLLKITGNKVRVEIFSLEKPGRPLYLEGEFLIPKR